MDSKLKDPSQRGATTNRGGIIVFEGGDRTGKSTQVKLLAEALTKQGRTVKVVKFPERSTAIGKIIDNVLQKKETMHLQALRLLFSANRWELAESILSDVRQGTTILMDRYCYSGVAYAMATQSSTEASTTTVDKLITPEFGLPAPDRVFWMVTPVDELVKRKQFGAEAFETKEIQTKVLDAFASMGNAKWSRIDGAQSIEVMHKEIRSDVDILWSQLGPIQFMKRDEFFM
jgi:dTMP kinase